MGLFRRRKEKPLDGNQEAIAGRIASRLLGVQRCSATWLNIKAKKIGQANVLLILVIMGLGFGLWFGWLIVGVLF